MDCHDEYKIQYKSKQTFYTEQKYLCNEIAKLYVGTYQIHICTCTHTTIKLSLLTKFFIALKRSTL